MTHGFQDLEEAFDLGFRDTEPREGQDVLNVFSGDGHGAREPSGFYKKVNIQNP